VSPTVLALPKKSPQTTFSNFEIVLLESLLKGGFPFAEEDHIMNLDGRRRKVSLKKQIYFEIEIVGRGLLWRHPFKFEIQRSVDFDSHHQKVMDGGALSNCWGPCARRLPGTVQ
jgi:hypothetical protein